jgi:crotonobetainyl-CoA:carnitine CoA-transferase CaiB-like acyl-CoA transferase
VGLALTDAPDARSATGSMAEIKRTALRLNQATAVPSMQADGVAALGVASAMLLGLLARRRGRPLGDLTTTMLATGTHALVDRAVDYPGRPDSPTADAELLGFSALYRMYRAADGWICLAAPAADEWPELVSALAGELDLGADDRFTDPAARTAADAALAEVLGGVFATRPAQEWEDRLTKAGVGCVVVTEQNPELLLQTDDELATTYCGTATSPVFEEYLRLSPLVGFSRSATQTRGGCLTGEHTDAVLTELGRTQEQIGDLRARGIVG